MSLESIPKSLPADSHLPISEASRQMVNQFIKRSNGRQEAMVEIYTPLNSRTPLNRFAEWML